ncbi:trigger factor [Paludibacter sp. 221]|uniref:trigger factor n=1 Tax=Paludibacter sp. 221 TaxID=2302939 RepID=UPI0013D65952|nr:trigger factor [Paludibacter sp. 221]NDV45998.1 trigger factor [Paludibacter sp. 221]
MNIAKKEIDQNNATLTISIEKADYADKVEKTLRDYRKKANMPGFRPGMVPMNLMKKMYGKSILAEEINKQVSETLYDYIRENNINILGEPLPNETEQPEIDFDTQENFEFVFDIAIAPEFDVNLTQKDKITYYNIKVSDDMIDNQVKAYTGRYGKYIQEEEVEEKDMVKGDLFELEGGKVKDGGIHVEGAVLTPAYMQDEDQKKLFVGAKKGDVIVFDPKKAYENVNEVSSMLKISKEQAETFNSECQITIEGITRYHEAEVNQELFDKIYGEGIVKTEAEFHEKIKESIQVNLKEDSDYKFALDARDTLVKKLKDVQFPDEFLKRWLITTNETLTAEKLGEDYPKMIEDLKWHLTKDKLMKANDIKVEPAEVEEYAKKVARAQFAQYGMIGIEDDILTNYAQDMLKKEDTIRNIVDKVAEDKVLATVKKSVKITEKEVSIEEFNKMFETK